MRRMQSSHSASCDLSQNPRKVNDLSNYDLGIALADRSRVVIGERAAPLLLRAKLAHPTVATTLNSALLLRSIERQSIQTSRDPWRP
jgi:hypothetical protein